jgi:hypothetical protein
MHIERLIPQHTPEWAALLTLCFDRQIADMTRLLDWLHLLYQPVSYGIWLDGQLVAQYTALYRELDFCGKSVTVGMSVNMAVHKDYRGRGLVKHMANPVYDTVAEWGAIIGMGFSNAEGVKVDKRSKGYGYHVVGQMLPLLGWLCDFHTETLELTTTFPDSTLFATSSTIDAIQFPKDAPYLCHRYASHPFREYRYGVWYEGQTVRGIVVYRHETTFGLSTAAVLDVYSDDVSQLLQRWSTTMQREGVRLVHALVSPQSQLRQTLSQLIPLVTVPYARTPYYLTAKSLHADYPTIIDDFSAWNLIGGDVL